MSTRSIPHDKLLAQVDAFAQEEDMKKTFFSLLQKEAPLVQNPREPESIQELDHADWEICRLLLGIGMDAKASTVPIYAAGNTPASIHGAWQMWSENSPGICSYNVPAFLPAIPLVVGIYFKLCPGKSLFLLRLLTRLKKNHRDS
ncbi:hypothetical protein BYT27DRAFT_7206478 [Phlegmacium glaucopus]|nr:hypothetical protein BYT27DRAFT_7206478 [Phlegmacium glaucopus]